MGSADEQFCLRWNDFQDCIKSTFQGLREEKDFMDVTISCDGEQLKAHKVILSACSVTFRNVLKKNPAQNPVIVLWVRLFIWDGRQKVFIQIFFFRMFFRGISQQSWTLCTMERSTSSKTISTPSLLWLRSSECEGCVNLTPIILPPVPNSPPLTTQRNLKSPDLMTTQVSRSQAPRRLAALTFKNLMMTILRRFLRSNKKFTRKHQGQE